MPLRERLADPPRSYTLLTIPLALILIITVLDLSLPKTVHLGPLLVVAPAITASFAGSWTTGAVAVITVATEVSVRAVRGGLSPLENAVQISSIVMVSVFVVIYAILRERRLKQLQQVRSVSEAAQRVVLRPLPHRIGPLRLASAYQTDTEESHIGGDLYAAARVNRATRLMIGDVRGKGLTTISDAAVLLCAFREAAHLHADLPRLVRHLEVSVCRNLAELAETDQNAREYFITAAVLEIPDDRPVVEMIDCGHPPPLLRHGPEVAVLQVTRPAAPLGLGELSESAYQRETFPFEAGDLLLLYTDGVAEARDDSGTFFPLTDRLRDRPDDDPKELVDRLRDDLLSYVGGRLGDDAAMIAVRREPV